MLRINSCAYSVNTNINNICSFRPNTSVIIVPLVDEARVVQQAVVTVIEILNSMTDNPRQIHVIRCYAITCQIFDSIHILYL